MATLAINGFEDNAAGTYSSSVKRSGEYSLHANIVGGGTGYVFVLGGYSSSDAYYRFYVRFVSFPSGDMFATFKHSGGDKGYLGINGSGQVTVHNENPSLIGTSTAVLSTDTWYCIELRIGSGASAAWELRIDGTTEASGTNSSFNSNPNSALALGKTQDFGGTGFEAYYDDVRVDSDGFPGESSILAMTVDSVGTDTGWNSTAGGSSTASDVSSIPSGATRAAVTSSGAAQTYGLESAASAGISGTINAIRAVAICQGVGVPVDVSVRVRSGANQSDSTLAHGDLWGYEPIQAFHAVEPGSGDPWTTTLLNSLEAGVVSNSTSQMQCGCVLVEVDFVPGAGSAPAAPSDLAVDATDGNSVDLSWTDNAGDADDQEDSFEIQYDTSPDFTAPLSITDISADSESTTVDGLEPTTTYYFRVRAVNGVGNSSWSEAVSASTTTDARSTLTQDEIELTFDGAYEVGRYACGGGYFVVADGGGDFTLNSVAESSPGVPATIGGVMVDPGSIEPLTSQGLDPSKGSYDSDLDESLPLTVNVSGGSKTIWVALLLDTPEVGGGNSGMRSIVQLTVVPSSPGAGAIKPTGYYVSGGKRQVSIGDIDFDAVTPTPIPGGASEPNWDSLKYHRRPLIRFGGTVNSAQIVPTLFQDSYSASQTLYTNPLLLGAVSDSAHRNELILRIVRCYLDIQALADLGDSTFTTLGGFGGGGKGLWFFGAVFLGDLPTLPDVVQYSGFDVQFFHEDACCFLGEPTEAYPLGKPLYGRDHDAGAAQYHNHDMRDLSGVREPHWLTSFSGVAQATSATTITLSAGTSGITAGDRVYVAEVDELHAISAWDDGTKVATIDGWSSTPSGNAAYEIYIGGPYQVIGSWSIVSVATAVVLSGLVSQWNALGGSGSAFFAYVKRWVEEDGQLNPRSTAGPGDDSTIFGDATGTWGKLFYTAAEENWPTATAATVTTAVAASITATTAVLGGEVTDDGDATVTARGVCWNTTGTPTLSDNVVSMGSGIGVFSGTATGLPSGAVVYVRAFATNSEGTAFGSQVSLFTVLPAEVAGRRFAIPHYWQPPPYPYTDPSLPDLIALTGTAMLDEQYLSTDYLSEMVALGVAAGSFVRYGVRTAPFGTDNADPRNTDDDVAEMAYREGRMQAVKAALDAEDLTLSLIYADTEIWPASAAPAEDPDRAAWFTARTAKFQSYIDMCASVFPGVPVMWYAQSARFPQLNTSNVPNGNYSVPDYVSIDDPGSYTNSVITTPEHLNAVAGAIALVGSENPAAAERPRTTWVWPGQHYQYYTVPGTFTSRTSDSVGVITANSAHQIQDGSGSCTVTWTSGGGGTRTGVTAAVSGTAITLSGGTGTALPLVGDPAEAMSIARFQNVNEDWGEQAAIRLGEYVNRILKPALVIFYPGPNLGDNLTPNPHWWTTLINYARGGLSGQTIVAATKRRTVPRRRRPNGRR